MYHYQNSKNLSIEPLYTLDKSEILSHSQIKVVLSYKFLDKIILSLFHFMIQTGLFYKDIQA